MLISVETNRQFTVSGIKDGKAWEKEGQWKVISDKLVLFAKESEMPGFRFRINRKPAWSSLRPRPRQPRLFEHGLRPRFIVRFTCCYEPDHPDVASCRGGSWRCPRGVIAFGL